MRKSMIVLIAAFILPMLDVSMAQEIARTLYVMNGLGQTLSKMNLETLEIMNDIVVVGDIPNRVYTREDRIYVVNSNPPGLTIIDGRTDAIINTIALAEGSNPWDMAFVGTPKRTWADGSGWAGLFFELS